MIYPLAFPSVKAPTIESLRIQYAQASAESPFTYAQTTVTNGDRWVLEFAWSAMSHQAAEVIQAWLDGLEGQIGTFRYAPRQARRSNLVGRTLALSASAHNNTVSIGGWTANSASALSRGQYLQIGTRLHRIVSAPAVADAQGRCVVEVQPMIRSSWAAGTAVNFQTPSGLFRLANAEPIGLTLDPNKRPTFPAIQAKEAFDDAR